MTSKVEILSILWHKKFDVMISTFNYIIITYIFIFYIVILKEFTA